MWEIIRRWIDVNSSRLTGLSDAVWHCAETALRETKSSALLADALAAAGFTVVRGVAGIPTAFTATFGCGKPVIGILGEYDALPGLSNAAEPAQKPLVPGAPGHGCGHNLLGAAGVGAAMAVKAAVEAGDVQGTVRFYGCPAEERDAGKVYMVREGLFADCEIALTWHPGQVNGVNLASSLAIDTYIFRFYGRTAHAAADPWNGRSALDAVELLNIGANYLREHIPSDARLHYITIEGGLAPNIVPNYAAVRYTVRSPRRDQAEDISRRLRQVAEGAARMTGTRCEPEYLYGLHNTLHNGVVSGVLDRCLATVGAPPFDAADGAFAAELSRTFPGRGQPVLRRFGTAAERLRGKLLCDEILPPYGQGTSQMGSTDVGNVSWVVPTGEFTMACSPIGTPGHSWQITASSASSVGHKGMLAAAKVLGLAAAEFMGRPDLIKAAQAELAEVTVEFPYRSPLPVGKQPPVPRQD
ncbi:MAG: amidohydrolase [bacterium]|jgi:aminobenzoyl-glutamate utilization protein B